MGILVDFSVLNQRGTPALFSDVLANRPAPGFVGRIFIDSNVPTTGIYRDTGTTWELIAGGVPTTPNLQQVTDAGNTTTNNVIFQGRAIVGGTATQSFHRLIVRDTGLFTTQRETTSIERTHTYDATASFINGPAYGSLAGTDSFNLSASITFPNGVSSASGQFSGVTIRPGGFNITQTQGTGIRALSGYRSQLTIEQSSVTNSTISHFAHFFATSIFKTNNSNPVTITNNYGIAISDQTEQSTGLTLTNRFGIAQFGTNDRNFFLGRVGIGTSTDAGFQLDVNGTARISGAGETTISSNDVISLASFGTKLFKVSLGITASRDGVTVRSGPFFSIISNNTSAAVLLLEKNVAGTNAAGLQFNTDLAGSGGIIWSRFSLHDGLVNFGSSSLYTDGLARWVFGANTDLNASAAVTIASTTRGFLPPVQTEAQINAIASPAEGLLVYNSTDKTLELRDGTIWENIPNGLKASAALDFPSTNAQNSSDLTITVTNAALNDMVMLGVPNGSVIANTCYTAWVSASNTVTVRFNNYSSAAQNPASGTFRVYVIKN